jgi:ketopantoate reductase
MQEEKGAFGNSRESTVSPKPKRPAHFRSISAERKLGLVRKGKGSGASAKPIRLVDSRRKRAARRKGAKKSSLVRKVVGEPPVHFRSVSLHSATPVRVKSYSPAIIPDETEAGANEPDPIERFKETSIVDDGAEGACGVIKPSEDGTVVSGVGSTKSTEGLDNIKCAENAENLESIESIESTRSNESTKNTENTEDAKSTGRPETIGRTTSFDNSERLFNVKSLEPLRRKKSHLISHSQNTERLETADFKVLFEQAVVESPSQKPTIPSRHGPHSGSSDNIGSGMSKDFSKRIDIVGFTPHTKFLTHSLSVSGHQPAGIYVHSKFPLTQWGLENREMTVYNQALAPISSTPVPYPTYIFDRRRYSGGPRDLGFFDNLIVDMSAASGISFFMELKARIDRRTTICLMHPGLGEMEMLNQKVFRDPANRPTYVLGYSTYNIAKMPGKMFSVQHRDAYPARILLHGVVEAYGTTTAETARAEEQRRQTQNLIQIMSSAPALNIVPVPWDIYLDSKLPKMIFRSLADTISVILGLQYRHIAPNAPAMRLWNNLLEEILFVISKFPELQAEGRPRRVYERLKGPTFRKTLMNYLACQEQNVSHWISWVRYGGGVPIDYFNGYFVKRAKELGLSTPYNDMAIDAVKSRIAQRRLELEADIPHNHSPYMSDHDLISDSEPINPLDMNLLKGMI